MNKFRAKSVLNGQWIYGWLSVYKFKKNGQPSYGISKVIDKEVFIEEIEKGTVGQKSGRTDILKNDIYAGDIIKFTNDVNEIITAEVLFLECMFCVIWEDNLKSIAFLENVEVVGNSFDNPKIVLNE